MLSVNETDAYQLNRGKLFLLCTAVGFDGSFDCEGTFIRDLLPKIASIYVPLRLVDSTKEFFSCCTNNKEKPNLVTPTGLPGKAVESFPVHGGK